MAIFKGFAFVGAQFNHIAHIHLAHVELDWQCAGIFHGVKEDGGNLGAKANTAKALVGNKGNVLAGPPEHRVGCGFTGRSCTDDIADIGNLMAFFLQQLNLLHRTTYASFIGLNTGTGIFQHDSGMQRNIRAAPGIRSRR